VRRLHYAVGAHYLLKREGIRTVPDVAPCPDWIDGQHVAMLERGEKLH